MKKHHIILTSAVLASSLVSCSTPHKAVTSGPSADFEKMKSLAGTWTGTMQMAKPTPVTVKYRVIANGSAVEERIFADSPGEMVTIYHDENGRLGLTHYCSLGNRPAMELVKSTADQLSFNLTSNSGIATQSGKHMHSLTLSFKDAKTLVHDWTLWDEGKAQPHCAFTLKKSN